MLPILPLLFLLLFPHAATLRAVEGGNLSVRHELRLLARSVEAAREEDEAAGTASKFEAREPGSVPAFTLLGHPAPILAGDRARDGPRV